MASLLLCAFTQSASGQGALDDIQPGEPIKPNERYTHSLFHFTLPLPAGWYLVSKDTEDLRLKRSYEKENNPDAALGEYLRTEIRCLLHIQKHPDGTDPLKDTSILMLASLMVDKKDTYGSPKEFQMGYVGGLGEIFKTEFEILKAPEEVKFGDKDFSQFSVRVLLPGAKIYKKIYDSLGEGYILNIHLTAPSEERLNEADRIIRKLIVSEPGAN